MNRWVMAAIGTALLAKIVLALTTYGTNDILVFEGYLATIKEHGGAALYHVGAELRDAEGTARHRVPFWMPPFVINLLLVLDGLSQITGLPMRAWLRIVAALADVGSLLILMRLFRLSVPVTCLIALAPHSILIAGFHGNTDGLMVMFLLGAVYLAERGRSLSAGAWYGLSCAVKVWPAIFLPCFVLALKSHTARSRFCLAAACMWILSGLPHFASDPFGIVARILAYRSVDTWWGLRLLSKVDPAVDQWLAAHGPVIVFVGIALWGARLQWEQASLRASVGLSSLAFMVFTPGFGWQYLVWLTPALGLLSTTELIALTSLAGVFLSYTYWSLADARGLVDIAATGVIVRSIVLGFPLWLWLVILLRRHTKRLRNRTDPRTAATTGTFRSCGGAAT